MTLPGTVQEIIETKYTEALEKAEIAVEGADPLYEGIRIDKTLKDERRNEVKVKADAEVEVMVEAEPKATVPKSAA